MHGVTYTDELLKAFGDRAGHVWLAHDTIVHGGGGERNGIEGIVVGIEGIDGMLGSGGKVTFGTVGMVGKLGSGGNVGLGRDGWVVGKVGNVGLVGKGGNVGLGKFGTEGRGGNWRRWRAAKATLMLEKAKAMEKAKMKHL
ncbi:unnamed protein product [Dovyalis caffra]|uniref:Uncharacterized protein n=1 Tax=Dovyalis caffra TaxID=77055 RepID=A0AAV1QRA7_9ROSI|nr:unnamed protein product [Dovyalis caffra]